MPPSAYGRRACGVIRAALRSAAVLVAGALLAQAQTKAPEWAERLVREVRSSSFPELLDEDIGVRQFSGSSDYFKRVSTSGDS